MTDIGAILICGIAITLGQIVWQFATWTDPVKEIRKHGKR